MRFAGGNHEDIGKRVSDGDSCRFDGKSWPCQAVRDLADGHELVPVCPEGLGGLPSPHAPCEIDTTCRALRVTDDKGTDVTDIFMSGACRTLEIAREQGCKLAILKSKSPSCSSGYIYDGSFSRTLTPGSGVTTRLLKSKGIRVVDEARVIDCTSALFASSSADTPTLQTERLVLRPVARDDAEDIFAYSKNPSVGRSAGWSPHRTIDDTYRFIEGIASSPHVFAIIEKESGQAIGTIGLIKDTFRRNTDCLMLGYALGEPWWGKGYATEAAFETIRYGFKDLGLALITCNHYLFNTRSKRVIERCGFTCEGTIREAESTPDGIMQDCVSYSLTRQEYFSGDYPQRKTRS